MNGRELRMVAEQSAEQSAEHEPQRESRRHGRLKCVHLVCKQAKREFGTVLDLSGSGMRLFIKGACRVSEGESLGLTLAWFDVTLPARCRVAWVRKTGFRKHLVGMEFVDVNPNFKAALTRLHQLARNALASVSAEFDARGSV